MPRANSPIRLITLVAGFTGAALGFWMCIGSALLYRLIVGGKWPAAYLPYCVIGFEFAVLVGGLTALFTMVAFARLGPRAPEAEYDPRFQVDKFGITVFCAGDRLDSMDRLLRSAGAQEVHEHRATEE
jgi:molybdopterin-containing oxidoreductase family membrane subunit